MAANIQAPRGVKDILPADSYKWQYIEGKIREICRQSGFKEIRTPMFEHTELFLRGVGDTTDVVQKEMYTFEDKGGRSITLRPEGTAGAARAFISMVWRRVLSLQRCITLRYPSFGMKIRRLEGLESIISLALNFSAQRTLLRTLK